MASRRELFLEKESYDDVWPMNGLAVLMGYLSMAIKGLGFLVLTWTTVVLLGGFVSMLHKKDFWSLTFITLVQMAGVFDVVLNEKLSYMWNSVIGLIVSAISGVMGLPPWDKTLPNFGRFVLALIVVLVQLMVLGALLCPLAIIYMLGVLMSGGISLWRLIEHDYGPNSGGEASNLVPAMDTLYYLALIQGVIFCYRFILGRSGQMMAKQVATKCDDWQLQLVTNYMHDTTIACAKDPSFAKGRNLITYAIDMIGSGSPVNNISGVKMLYTAIFITERRLEQLVVDNKRRTDAYSNERAFAIGQRMLMKHLLLYASSSRHVLQSLLETLDSRGIHDRETRNQAATIVERVAFNINLEKFPGGIQHISSLLGTFEEYFIAQPYEGDYLLDNYEQEWKLNARCLPPTGESREAYKELLLNGLRILMRLAADENNCRVMSNTGNLVSKIMATVTTDLLNHSSTDHGSWSDIVERSMEVIIQLAGAPGETGAKVRREISSCRGAMETLWRILNCNKCKYGLQLNAILILTQLYMDNESSKLVDSVLKKEISSRSTDFVIRQERRSREGFIKMLLYIFTHEEKYTCTIRGSVVGGALLEICLRGGSSDSEIVMQASGSRVVDSLTKVLLQMDISKARRGKAAEILEYLCTHYTKDDEYLGKLKKAMTDAVPAMIDMTRKVIEELLNYEGKLHVGKESHQYGFARPRTDIEHESDYDGGEIISSLLFSLLPNYGQNQEDALDSVMLSVGLANLLSSLLSLCGTIYNTFVSELSADLAPQFDVSSLLNKLTEVVLKRWDHPTVENLSVFKAIAKMVTSLMKHGGRLVKRDDLKSLMEALSTASNNMLDLDHSMVFWSAANSGSALKYRVPTLWKIDEPTLASLVQDLCAMVPSSSVTVEP